MSMQFINTELPDLIELRNVGQKYGEKIVLDNFNMLIEDKPNNGQFVVILGESGCGKSTILRYVCGLQKPTSGEVFIKGKKIEDKDRVGMVFQQYSSFPWLSVLDNVAFGLKMQGVKKKERNEKALEMIKLVGLDGHEKKFAKSPTLSGGQLQRVAIARSLLANPEMLVMDEPFGALDVTTRSMMQDMLLNIWEKLHTTIIFITHDIPEAVYLADDLYVMAANPGRIVRQFNVGQRLPYPRNKSLKRNQEFFNIVNEIEDFMLNPK